MLKAGDKVICIIDDKGMLLIKKGEIYLVKSVIEDEVNIVLPDNSTMRYTSYRFVLATPLTEQLC